MKAEFVLSASNLVLDKSKQSLTNTFQKYSLNIFYNACNEILRSVQPEPELSLTHISECIGGNYFQLPVTSQKKKDDNHSMGVQI